MPTGVSVEPASLSRPLSVSSLEFPCPPAPDWHLTPLGQGQDGPLFWEGGLSLGVSSID